jgi:hypothetical protein
MACARSGSLKPGTINSIASRIKSEGVIATALAGGTILSRLPFQATLLYTFDAVNYALALDHFDMRLHQPQPPGYPLYILLGRLFNLFLQDHRAALVWLSTVASGLAAVAVYLVGRDMAGRRVGIFAALLLASSPLFWSQSEIASPYALDVFASALVGWLCYRTATSPQNARLAWISALAVGLAGAFRLQTMLVLFPLFLYALHRRPWKVIVGAVAAAGAVFSAFLLPAVMASGGVAAFLSLMFGVVPILQSTETLARSTRAARFIANIYTTARYSATAVGEMVLPLALIGYLTCSDRLRFWRNRELWFLILWAAPTWALYFLVWPGNLSTVLVCVAPFFLLAGMGLNRIVQQPRWGPAMGYATLAVVLSWHIVVFTLLPQRPFGPAYRQFANYQAIKGDTKIIENELSLVSAMPVEGTIVYTSDIRHLQYYLPQYHTFSQPTLDQGDPQVVRSILFINNGALQKWERVATAELVPPDTKRIVLIDLPTLTISAPPALVEEESKNGVAIQVLSIPPDYAALWTPEGLSLIVR